MATDWNSPTVADQPPTSRIRLLLIEAAHAADPVLEALREYGFEPVFERVDTAKQLAEAMDRGQWDVAVSSFALPRLLGTDALEIVRRTSPDLPFLFIADDGIEDKVIATMGSGVQDCIERYNLRRLGPAVRRELEHARTRLEQKQACQTLRYLTYHDPTTGLPNYAYFHDRLEQALVNARRRDVRGALLTLKINEFREINETFGHQVGDLILRYAAGRLREVLPAGCEMACLRANEFAVLIPEVTSDQHPMAVAVACVGAMQQPVIISQAALEATIRLGIALFPDHGSDSSALLQNARKAHYLARRTRSQYALYSPEAEENRALDLGLVSDLRRAINENQLELVYQPKIELPSGRVVGVEALARWNHPRLGPIPPARFIPLAERTGLITPLTLWSVGEAIAQWRRWARDAIRLRIAVNLSMQNSSVTELWDRLFDQLDGAHISPDQLQLEITESVVMINPAATLQNMKRLRQIGVGFSIDDFGVGYSSLAYLKRLPIDEIKIDKSFVMHSAENPEDAAIVNLIVQMGHQLGLRLVAEGVEDRATLAFLRRIGCDMAQGYYIGRPAGPRELLGWLDSWPGKRLVTLDSERRGNQVGFS